MIEHGKGTNYRNGKCREACCREAHRRDVAKNRADRLASGRINHGRRAGYDAGCRCPACRGSRSVAWTRESQRAAARRVQTSRSATNGRRSLSRDAGTLSVDLSASAVTR